MPIENDLSTEERAELAEHGVTFQDNPPAPVAEAPPPAPVADTPPVAEVPPTASPEPVPATLELKRDPTTGQFVAPPPTGTEIPTTGVTEGTGALPGAPPAGFVPHAALHAERARSAELARSMQTMQTRVNALLTQGRDPDPLPNPETEPVAFLEALGDRVIEIQQTRQQETQTRNIDNAIEQDEATFAEYQTDYPAASNHFVQSRAAELLLTHTREATQRIMTDEVRQMANVAWQRGIPVAQLIYDSAKSRGYTVAAAPAAAPAPVALTPEAIVAAAQKGQKESRTMSGPGGQGAKELDATALLAMSDSEFEDYLKLGNKGANDRFAAIAGR